jgi:NADH-quinone oxidoreductase subunit M
MMGITSIVLWLPLLGALLLMLLPASNLKAIRYGALGVSVVTFLASLVMFSQFKGGTYHFQLVQFRQWLPDLGVNYYLGVDGISIWLVMLSTFLMVISIWFSFYVQTRVKTYMILILMLETTMLGVFLSLDMILFYTFFEASLIPMYFLISIWGGERRAYASLKFFIYTFAGSIFMLVGMIALYFLHREATGISTFSIPQIQAAIADGKLWADALQFQALLFWAFALAFLIKTPAFPFHTWLPDAHVEAPTAGSVILAGVLLKMGTYGFLRFCLPMFPDVIAQQVPIMMSLAVIGIIYGALVAAVQPDVKKLVAYSSVAHMGFVMLGIFSLTHTGLMGGAMQQLNHGISTGALFLLIGFIYERRHTRMFGEFGGLKAQMPIYAWAFLIVMLSSVGLPGTNGFVGEFLAMMGAFQASFAGAYGLNVGFAVVAGFGVVLAAVYLLYMFQQMFYGPNKNPENQRLKDLKPWEIVAVGSLIVFIFWGGFFPNTFLKPMEASLQAARLMAINPAGERPKWTDRTMEIDMESPSDPGALVRVAERSQQEVGNEFTPLGPIAAGKMHLRVPGPVVTAPKMETIEISDDVPLDSAAAGSGLLQAAAPEADTAP